MATKKTIDKLHAWAVFDQEVGLIDVYTTRKDAREQKQFAAKHGYKQVIAKLSFDEVIR